MPAMIAAALASLCLLQDAPPAPVPAPAAQTPAAAPAATPAADAPAAPAKPRQVWVFIDRWKEFGGTVVEEREAEFTVEGPYGERRSFNRNQVLDVIELVHPEPGQRGIVQLRDGTIVRGEILKDALDEVEFRVDSIKGTLPREKVYRVVLELDFETRYRRIRASILPEEHGRRVALARWLAENERLDLAVEELEALLREADSDAARDLLREVNARLTLQKSIEESRRREREKREAQDAAQPKAPAPAGDGAGAPDGSGGPAAPPADAPPTRAMPTNRDMLPDNLISDEDVNLIRVYEIDFKDPPRLAVKPEGIRQLILRYGSSDLIPASSEERNLLYTKPAIEVVRLMFSLRARDLYRYIEVDEDPGSLALFRTRVHNSWLTANCATSRCHGGLHAGRFFLHTGNAKDQRIRYTNLLALLDFEVDGKPMVDFEDPPSSLLVQYAMPRNMARYPHPQVNGWKPVFSKSTPQLLSDTLEWIRGMYRPRPEYPVQYRRPDLEAPDAPVRNTDGPDR
jgi:hypothetical protein